MWRVLHAVQVAKPKGQDARRISFRDIDVEQIGYIYEACSVTPAAVLTN